MVYRKLPELSAERRQALIREIKHFSESERQAALNKVIWVSKAVEAGMTAREVAPELGVSHQTVNRWRAEGDQARG